MSAFERTLKQHLVSYRMLSACAGASDTLVQQTADRVIAVIAVTIRYRYAPRLYSVPEADSYIPQQPEEWQWPVAGEWARAAS